VCQTDAPLKFLRCTCGLCQCERQVGGVVFQTAAPVRLLLNHPEVVPWSVPIVSGKFGVVVFQTEVVEPFGHG
jgi:hypothetical protein